MKAKFIVSSSAFLDVLLYIVNKTVDNKIEIKSTMNVISFGDTPLRLHCHVRYNFSIPLYKSCIEKLIKILSMIGDQPLTLQLEDSETFNVKICEAYV